MSDPKYQQSLRAYQQGGHLRPPEVPPNYCYFCRHFLDYYQCTRVLCKKYNVRLDPASDAKWRDHFRQQQEEEKRRREEDLRRVEEEWQRENNRRQEEARRQEEERKREEERRLAEERRLKEEEKRREEEKKREEEERRAEEEKRRAEEEKRREEEKKREEEERRAEEEKRGAEEEKRRAEKEQKRQEEKKQTEEKRNEAKRTGKERRSWEDEERAEGESEQYNEPDDRDDFKVGIICALPLEASAVLQVFDKTWKAATYGKKRGDPNQYSLGSIGPHNVVLVHLPKDVTTVNAAATASTCRMSFPSIELVLLVGISGSAPTSKSNDEEIILGDVVISTGVVEYSSGHLHGDRAKTTHLGERRPHPELSNLLAKLEVEEYLEGLKTEMATLLSRLAANKAPYPGASEDRLFEPGYSHKHNDGYGCSRCLSAQETGGCGCDEASRLSCVELSCSQEHQVVRDRSGEKNEPTPHLGLVASADRFPSSGIQRDKITEETKAIAFDTGLSARVWESFLRVLVIKGVYHYSDGHKHKITAWQKYAAATAAACTKAILLEHWQAEDVESEDVDFDASDVESDARSGSVD